VTSERKLIEELQMHLAWRWFTGLSFDLAGKTMRPAFSSDLFTTFTPDRNCPAMQ